MDLYRKSSMADILIVSSNAKDWKKDSGGKERTAVLAEALKGHNVTFLSFNWNGVNKTEQVYNNVIHVEVKIEPGVQRKYLRIIRGLVKNNYDAAFNILKPELQAFSKKVSQLSKQSDLVIFDHYATAPFVDDVPKNIPVIYNAHNAEIVMANQLYPDDKNLIKIVREMESKILYRAKAITYCSKDDAEILAKEYGFVGKSFYIPNGTEIDVSIDTSGRINSKDIFFVGSGHPPNVVAAKNLLPVAEQAQEYRFVLCGDASNSIRNSPFKNIKTMGYVTDDTLSGFFANSFAFINPMETGSGTHLKMMKALGYGMPIISSEVGARGFSKEEIDKSMIIANTTQEMLAAIKKLEDTNYYEKLAAGAKEVGKLYDWATIQEDYLSIINDIIKAHPATGKEKPEIVSNINKEKVLVYSIIRNRGSNIGAYHAQLKACVEAMPEYEFYLSIYENDSTDMTKKNLFTKDWSFFSGVSIISENINTPYFGSVKDATRVEILANARNKAIEAGGFLDKVDYVLMVEGDVSFDVNSFKRLLEFKEQEPDFDIVSSISLRRNGTHYDWWATRTGPVFNEKESEIEKDFKKKDYGRYYSTSNGLCLYRAKPFQEGVRHHWINTVTKEFDCEMVVLCQNFQAAGYNNIFINYRAKAVH